jgi:hypothetical protein
MDHIKIALKNTKLNFFPLKIYKKAPQTLQKSAQKNAAWKLLTSLGIFILYLWEYFHIIWGM